MQANLINAQTVFFFSSLISTTKKHQNESKVVIITVIRSVRKISIILCKINKQTNKQNPTMVHH